MTDLVLTRSYRDDCTMGMCMAGPQSFFTIEQPWRNNEKGSSCVPEGRYDLIPYTSPKHGPTWYLKSDALGVGGPEAQRSFCELHAANFARQLEGCIAFGLKSTPMLDPSTGVVEPAIEDSRAAIADLIEILGSLTSGHTLTVSSETGVPIHA